MISQTIRKMLPGVAAAACLSLGAAAAADPLVAAIGLEVDNPSIFVPALDRLQKSDDVGGTKLGLWVPEFSSGSGANHVVVVEYEDYADYEARSARRLASRDWQTFIGTVSDASRLVNSLLMVQRMAAGEGWRNHGASAVYMMSVSDPVKYAQAFDRVIGAQGHPGSVRLLEVRAGSQGGVSHVVVFTAPGFAALNEYLDKLLASEDYRRFADQVRSIRTINAVSQYRRIQSWGS